MVRTLAGWGEARGHCERFRELQVSGALCLITICAQAAFANTDNIPNRQAGINLLRQSTQRFWNHRVEFQVNGFAYPGYATHCAVDPGEGFWGDEAGSHCDSPLWDFQNSDGAAGALMAFLHSYSATGDKAQLRRAEAIGDTLLYVQQQLDGGWFQDGAVIDGQYRNVGVWGAWGNRRHADGDLQNWFTLDDFTSQSCAMALLRLYQVGGEPRFLDGARIFGDKLANLRHETWNGSQPYANGGLPQALPLYEAFTTGYQGNQDPRNPDGPYQPHKTLNDGVMSACIIFLMELYEETNSQSYLNAVRLNVDYLLTRFEANGARGWSQQYHWLTDRPAWGRGKEPPSYVTCETDVVTALLLWRQRETNTMRRLRIELNISNYLYWLRDEAQHPEADQVWRYYNYNPLGGQINAPMFAADYNCWVGAQYENNAAGGQPYRGRWDLVWATRLQGTGNGFDFSRAAQYLEGAEDLPLDVRNVRWSPTPELPDALYISDTNVNGQARRKLQTSATVFRIYALSRTLSTLGGNVTDSDGDGYPDVVETQEGSDPLDSESVPLTAIGDVNCDGIVSVSDIQPFVQVLTNPSSYELNFPNCNLLNADVDQNGEANVNDIAAFISLLVGK